MSSALVCPVCGEAFAGGDYAALARHFEALAGANDAPHIMWLNRRVSKHRLGEAELARLLRELLSEGRASSAPRVAR